MRLAGRRLSRDDRHVEGLSASSALQMILQCPADDQAREGIQHDGEIDEGLLQPDVGDVGDPNLVDAGGDEIANQIGQDAKAVPAVGGFGDEARLAQAQQIVLTHQAQNPLAG